MNRLFFSCYLVSLFHLGFSQQKEAAHWYFGFGAGVDFNKTPPVGLTDGQTFNGGLSATISDRNGSLLFYTESGLVWNRNHQIMPNGTGLSSTSAATLIARNPYSETEYFIFYSNLSPNPPPFAKLYYSVVDMSLDNGLGDVVATKKIL